MSAFAVRTEENLIVHQHSRSTCRDLNPGALEYEAGVLTARPRRSSEQLVFLLSGRLRFEARLGDHMY